MAETFYVSTENWSRNDPPTNGWGTSIDYPFRTISYAVYQASLNNETDTIYVKAGVYDEWNDEEAENYGGPSGFWDSNGDTVIEEADLQLIGYNTSPGDLDQGRGVPANYESFYSGDNSLDAGAAVWNMPLIQGPSNYQGTGVQINTDNVVVKNFHIKRFDKGVFLSGTTGNNRKGILLDNLLLSAIGDPNLDGTGIGIWTYAIGETGGSGFDNDITNCFIQNAAECGMRIRKSVDTRIFNCQIYCDDDTTPNSNNSATDYYIDISASSNNTISYCRVERIGPLYHGGHGFVIQASVKAGDVATGNQFFDCDSTNIDQAFLIRYSGASNNLFEDCTSYLDPDPDDLDTSVANSRRPYGCITIYTGAHDNRFSRIRITNAEAGIQFVHNQPKDEDATNCSYRNDFENSIFDNCEVGIRLEAAGNALDTSTPDPDDFLPGNDAFDDDTNETTYRVLETDIVNRTFVGGEIFLRRNRGGATNKLINCIVKDFDNYLGTGSGVSTVSHGFTFDHCLLDNLANAGFPTGPEFLADGNIEDTPHFDYDFVLDGSSPCIDKGAPVLYGIFDFYGGNRYQGPEVDIGADEYPGN